MYLSSPDLHRVIIITGASPEDMTITVFVQYYYEDEEYAVLVQSYGNQKQNRSKEHRKLYKLQFAYSTRDQKMFFTQFKKLLEVLKILNQGHSCQEI